MKWAGILLLLVIVTAGCVEREGDAQQTPTSTPVPTETPAPSPSPGITPPPTATPTTTPIVTPTPEPQTYRVYVDDDYGFHRVRHLSDHPRTDLDVKNLEIRVGDTIIWHNDDDESDRVDIISNDGLWNITTNPDAALMWSGREFHYTFDKPGTYTFSLGYYPRVYRKLGNQTIAVRE